MTFATNATSHESQKYIVLVEAITFISPQNAIVLKHNQTCYFFSPNLPQINCPPVANTGSANFYRGQRTDIILFSDELTAGIFQLIHACTVTQRMILLHRNPKCHKSKVLYKVNLSHCLPTFTFISQLVHHHIFFPPSNYLPT